MKVDNCYQLGEVLKTHGLKGELIIHLDSDEPQRYKKLESMFLLRAGRLVPFFISSVQIQGDTARIKIEDIDALDDATPLVGSPIYLPLSTLPDLGSKAYYFHELIGFQVRMDKEVLGLVTEIYDQEKNPLFAFDHEGHEVLVPFNFVVKVDKNEKAVHVNLPEGYLAIYTES